MIEDQSILSSPASAQRLLTDALSVAADGAATTSNSDLLPRRRRSGDQHAGVVLAVCEAVALVAVATAVFVATGTFAHAAAVASLFALVQIAVRACTGSYSGQLPSVRSDGPDATMLVSPTIATWSFVVLTHLGGLGVDLRAVVMVWALTLPVMPMLRHTAHQMLGRRALPERVGIVGGGVVGRQVAQRLRSAGAAKPVDVVAFLDPDPLFGPEHGIAPLSRDVGEFELALRRAGATRVIVAHSVLGHAQLLDVVARCDRAGIRVDVVPRLHELFAHDRRFDSLDGVPLLSLPTVRRSRTQLFAKRVIDVVGAATLLILLAPLLAILAVAIRLESIGPVLFRQERVGLHGRLFAIVKFRTMKEEQDEPIGRGPPPRLDGFDKLQQDERITRLGRTLRVTSLDELPQLWNVLRGEMSLVGPRPLPVAEFAAVRWSHDPALDVPPGMTGLWQVLGRSDIAFPERMRLDRLYARNRSLRWDLRLLLATLPAIARRRGAY